MPQQIKTCKRITQDDEFFTMYKDCVRELHKYDLRGRKIICPCDNKNSNIYKYLKDCYYDVKCDCKEWRKIDYSKYDLVITNPPYKYAKEFVLKALDLVDEGHKVYMFLKLTFLEGKARYKDLFSKHPPKVIYVFSERVMCAKNGNFAAMKAGGGSAVAYAWYVWQKGYRGDTVIKWL